MIFTPVRKWQRMRRLLPPDWAPGITMRKPMKGALCIQSSFPSLHPEFPGIPKDGTAQGVPAAAQAPFAAVLLVFCGVFFSFPVHFCPFIVLLKGTFRKDV